MCVCACARARNAAAENLAATFVTNMIIIIITRRARKTSRCVCLTNLQLVYFRSRNYAPRDFDAADFYVHHRYVSSLITNNATPVMSNSLSSFIIIIEY